MCIFKLSTILLHFALELFKYIEIPTTGNALDFADLAASGHNLRAYSNAHGGL